MPQVEKLAYTSIKQFQGCVPISERKRVVAESGGLLTLEANCILSTDWRDKFLKAHQARLNLLKQDATKKRATKLQKAAFQAYKDSSLGGYSEVFHRAAGKPTDVNRSSHQKMVKYLAGQCEDVEESEGLPEEYHQYPLPPDLGIVRGLSARKVPEDHPCQALHGCWGLWADESFEAEENDVLGSYAGYIGDSRTLCADPAAEQIPDDVLLNCLDWYMRENRAELEEQDVYRFLAARRQHTSSTSGRVGRWVLTNSINQYLATIVELADDATMPYVPGQPGDEELQVGCSAFGLGNCSSLANDPNIDVENGTEEGDINIRWLRVNGIPLPFIVATRAIRGPCFVTYAYGPDYWGVIKAKYGHLKEMLDFVKEEGLIAERKDLDLSTRRFNSSLRKVKMEDQQGRLDLPHEYQANLGSATLTAATAMDESSELEAMPSQNVLPAHHRPQEPPLLMQQPAKRQRQSAPDPGSTSLAPNPNQHAPETSTGDPSFNLLSKDIRTPSVRQHDSKEAPLTAAQKAAALATSTDRMWCFIHNERCKYLDPCYAEAIIDVQAIGNTVILKGKHYSLTATGAQRLADIAAKGLIAKSCGNSRLSRCTQALSQVLVKPGASGAISSTHAMPASPVDAADCGHPIPLTQAQFEQPHPEVSGSVPPAVASCSHPPGPELAPVKDEPMDVLSLEPFALTSTVLPAESDHVPLTPSPAVIAEPHVQQVCMPSAVQVRSYQPLEPQEPQAADAEDVKPDLAALQASMAGRQGGRDAPAEAKPNPQTALEVAAQKEKMKNRLKKLHSDPRRNQLSNNVPSPQQVNNPLPETLAAVAHRPVPSSSAAASGRAPAGPSTASSRVPYTDAQLAANHSVDVPQASHYASSPHRLVVNTGRPVSHGFHPAQVPQNVQPTVIDVASESAHAIQNRPKIVLSYGLQLLVDMLIEAVKLDKFDPEPPTPKAMRTAGIHRNKAAMDKVFAALNTRDEWKIVLKDIYFGDRSNGPPALEVKQRGGIAQNKVFVKVQQVTNRNHIVIKYTGDDPISRSQRPSFNLRLAKIPGLETDIILEAACLCRDLLALGLKKSIRQTSSFIYSECFVPQLKMDTQDDMIQYMSNLRECLASALSPGRAESLEEFLKNRLESLPSWNGMQRILPVLLLYLMYEDAWVMHIQALTPLTPEWEGPEVSFFEASPVLERCPSWKRLVNPFVPKPLSLLESQPTQDLRNGLLGVQLQSPGFTKNWEWSGPVSSDTRAQRKRRRPVGVYINDVNAITRNMIDDVAAGSGLECCSFTICFMGQVCKFSGIEMTEGPWKGLFTPFNTLRHSFDLVVMAYVKEFTVLLLNYLVTTCLEMSPEERRKEIGWQFNVIAGSNTTEYHEQIHRWQKLLVACDIANARTCQKRDPTLASWYKGQLHARPGLDAHAIFTQGLHHASEPHGLFRNSYNDRMDWRVPIAVLIFQQLEETPSLELPKATIGKPMRQVAKPSGKLAKPQRVGLIDKLFDTLIKPHMLHEQYPLPPAYSLTAAIATDHGLHGTIDYWKRRISKAERLRIDKVAVKPELELSNYSFPPNQPTPVPLPYHTPSVHQAGPSSHTQAHAPNTLPPAPPNQHHTHAYPQQQQQHQSPSGNWNTPSPHPTSSYQQQQQQHQHHHQHHSNRPEQYGNGAPNVNSHRERNRADSVGRQPQGRQQQGRQQHAHGRGRVERINYDERPRASQPVAVPSALEMLAPDKYDDRRSHSAGAPRQNQRSAPPDLAHGQHGIPRRQPPNQTYTGPVDPGREPPNSGCTAPVDPRIRPSNPGYTGYGGPSRQPPNQGYAGHGDNSQQPPNQGYARHGDISQQPPNQGYAGHGDISQQPPNQGYVRHGDISQQPPNQGYVGHGDISQQPPNQGYLGHGDPAMAQGFGQLAMDPVSLAGIDLGALVNATRQS